jgi:ubiquinone/menaquinone biosynthesis C-methylase UbiE
VPQASGVVLEIGFGPGLNLSHYDPGKIERVIGVDPNEGFLRLGSGARPPVPVEVFRAPAEAIPLPDDVADTAIVTYTLCSVEDPARALGEGAASSSRAGACCSWSTDAPARRGWRADRTA